jgi:hypothetical protein
VPLVDGRHSAPNPAAARTTRSEALIMGNGAAGLIPGRSCPPALLAADAKRVAKAGSQNSRWGGRGCVFSPPAIPEPSLCAIAKVSSRNERTVAEVTSKPNR